ncbi:hypothetical protein CBER1_06049 [Cercospora berteroae]|uniref:Uncharacterized protein n=1 Tax=Cercospora berteroae TaxID=357750 RepID=A0A2S6C576_9PEZI|nr:hypothetical protein CBER1_06049 [Cercospora berteroae]
MFRLLLPSTLLSLMFHGFLTPSDAAAILRHRSSGGNGTGYWGQNPNPYSNPYSPYPPGYGSSGAPGAGQPHSGGSGQRQNPNPYASYPGGGYSSSGAGKPYSGGSGSGSSGQPQTPNPYSSNPGGYSSLGTGQLYGGGGPGSGFYGQPQNPNPYSSYPGGYGSSGAGRPYSGGSGSGYYGQNQNPNPYSSYPVGNSSSGAPGQTYSGGSGRGYSGQSSNPYPPYSGGQSSSGAGQSYSGRGKQPAYGPPTAGQGSQGGVPPRPPKRPGEETPPGPPRKKPNVEVACDDLIRKYAVPGREMYNAWLMADTAMAAGQLMSQNDALGPDPQDHGWQRSRISHQRIESEWTLTETTQSLNTNDLLGLKGILGSLQVGTEASNAPVHSRQRRNVNVEPYDGKNAETTGANIRIRLEQNEAYHMKSSKRLHGPLEGYYETTMNIMDGVIIAEQYQDLYRQWSMRNGGASLNPKQRPFDATWSDATWYLWRAMRAERAGRRGNKVEYIPYKTSSPDNPFVNVAPHVTWNELQMASRDRPPATTMGNFLNYIFVTNIQDTDTLAIILKCIDSRQQENVAIANNLVFPIGHWCFYALLGTSANHMVAEFLAQHRGDLMLGHKVLMSATIHNSVVVGTQRGPAIQWTVSADVATARTRKAAMENFWLPSADSRGAYGYPSVPERAYEWNC